MNHLLVFEFVIAVLVGTWATLVAWQRYQRRPASQLRHFFHYVAAFNVMAFGYLVAHYSITNLLGSNPAEFPRAALVLSVGVFPIEAGLSWTALRLSWDLRRRTFPMALRLVFLAGATMFCASYVAGVTLLLRNGGFVWLARTHMALGVAMTVALVAAFLGLALCRTRDLDASQRRSLRRLGWSLLAGYAAFTGSVALPAVAHLPTLATALLWLNCVPLIWLRGGFGEYDLPAVADEDATAAIAALARERGVTKREREIMELIAQGKSNKEIEAQLCISFSTVKNHAYNLYRKLGVSSRAQLIHLVLAPASRPRGTAADIGSPARGASHGASELRRGA